MPMTSRNESVKKLLKLLQDEFQLPESVINFNVICRLDDVVKIEVLYVPKDMDVSN